MPLVNQHLDVFSVAVLIDNDVDPLLPPITAIFVRDAVLEKLGKNALTYEGALVAVT